jgi:hypothetical protein
MKFSTALAPRGFRPGGSGGPATRPGTIDFPARGEAVRGRSRQGATARSAAAARSRARHRGGGRGPGVLPRRTRCSWGGNGSWAGGRGRSSAGIHAGSRPAVGLTVGWAPSCGPTGESGAGPRHGRAERGVEVVGQLRRQGIRGRWECPDDEPCAGRQVREAVADEVAQPAGHAVPHDRPADGAAHHETGTRTRLRRGRNGGEVQMHHESGAATPATPADGRGELVPPGEPGAGRQHRRRRIRPRAARGPCGGDRRGSRARPGCASAA